MSEPILAHFDPDLETVLEADASGWATGGTLSQFGRDGKLRTVAYFSAKNTPAESNYTIHDKELLAVIKCVEEWNSELRAVPHVRVFTDHKNLQYFTASRRLSERHVRWSDILSSINMTFEYRSGKANGRADALSRREQDTPKNPNDERVKSRRFQLLTPEHPSKKEISNLHASLAPAIRILLGRTVGEEGRTPEIPPEEGESLSQLWDLAEESDDVYQRARTAIQEGARKFPPSLNLKISLAECSVETNKVLFRGREWVPDSEPLRTTLIKLTHDSRLTGHPGREITYKMLAKSYFWPGMSNQIRRYIQNCSIYGRTKPWRELKQGFLKPLPVPERAWKDISMDFIVDLPASEGCKNIMVVTDRLSKGVVVIPLPNIQVETVAQAFIDRVVAYHWLPDSIVSDRGTQFTSDFWKELCRILKIERRLSTADHPETDGSTERMNAVVEAILRAYVNWKQDDWKGLCSLAQIAIRSRPATSTGVSPFFLQHGYEVDPIQLWLEDSLLDLHQQPRSEKEAAQAIVRKYKETIDFINASLAEAQQEQERNANKRRRESPILKVGDRVWLEYGRQLSNTRPSKKLDWKNAKFQVVEVISPHNVRLNVPRGIHDVFHVDRLKLALENPLPSQGTDDWQPEAVISIDGEEEWEVEDIVAEVWRKNGRRAHSFEVKWRGYAQTTVQRREALEDTLALDRWEERTSHMRDAQGRLPVGCRWEGGTIRT